LFYDIDIGDIKLERMPLLLVLVFVGDVIGLLGFVVVSFFVIVGLYMYGLYGLYIVFVFVVVVYRC
jgi:hypothetical protein